MFSEESIGLAGGISFGLAALVIAVYLMLNARDAASHLVALFIIVLPLMGSPYLPGQVFGIRGLSPVNFVTALSCLAIFAKIGLSGRVYGYILRFFSLPLLIVAFVFVYSAGVTYLDADHLYYLGPSSRLAFSHSPKDFLLYECVRPAQIMIVGMLVLVVCDLQGGKRLIQRALLLAPIALSTLALLFSVDAGLENYRASREMLGIRMGLHGNSFGAISVYYLIAAITMREHDMPMLRYVAIGFAVLGVVLSYSRIAFLAALLVLALLYFTLPAKEKVVVAGLVAIVLVLFSGQLIARVQYGLTESSAQIDINAISAGRVYDIWLPGFRQFLERPIFGYGIAMLVDTPTVGRWAPHNGYLEIVLNSGLVGLFAIANLVFWSFRYCIKNGDETMYLILAMMILALTGATFYPTVSNYVIWAFYGMLVHGRYQVKLEREEASTTIISGEIRGLHKQPTN